MAADKRVTKDDKLKATPGKIVKNTDKDKVAVSKKIVGQSIADSSKSATKEMTLNDVMGAIMEMKKVQESQNTKLSDLTGRMTGVEQGTSGDVGMDFDEYGNYNDLIMMNRVVMWKTTITTRLEVSPVSKNKSVRGMILRRTVVMPLLPMTHPLSLR